MAFAFRTPLRIIRYQPSSKYCTYLFSTLAMLCRLRTLYTNSLLLLLVEAVLPLLLARQFRSTARIRIIIQDSLSKINFTRSWNLGGVFSRVFLLCELTTIHHCCATNVTLDFFISIAVFKTFILYYSSLAC